MSALNPFDSVSQEVSLPGLTTGGISQKPSPDEFQYRIGYYQIGGENGFDSQAELEALMTRSIRPDGGVMIVEPSLRLLVLTPLLLLIWRDA